MCIERERGGRGPSYQDCKACHAASGKHTKSASIPSFTSLLNTCTPLSVGMSAESSASKQVLSIAVGRTSILLVPLLPLLEDSTVACCHDFHHNEFTRYTTIPPAFCLSVSYSSIKSCMSDCCLERGGRTTVSDDGDVRQTELNFFSISAVLLSCLLLSMVLVLSDVTFCDGVKVTLMTRRHDGMGWVGFALAGGTFGAFSSFLFSSWR